MRDTTFVEVKRPAQSKSAFLDEARAIADIIFESDEATSTVTITDKELAGDDPISIGSRPNLYRVYGYDGLRLPLIERVTVPEARAGNSFSNVAKILRDGKKSNLKHSRPKSQFENELDEEFEILPIKTQLNRVQAEYGYEDPNNLRVKIDHVGYRFEVVGGNGSWELTLVPSLGEETTTILHDQAKLCALVIGKIARKVALPDSYHHLEIPFARISDRVATEQLERYLKQLSGLMHQYVILGEPKVTHQITS
jgi:hypothetical protein